MEEKSYKLGGGNQPQQYYVAGNGDKSGEYADEQEDVVFVLKKAKTKAAYEESKAFCKRFNCTRECLLDVLGEKIISCIIRYSNYATGISINYAIRNNTLSEEQTIYVDFIIKAIKTWSLKESLQLYRGISVSEEVFEKDFLLPFKNGEPKIGSVICSTSRSFDRAKLAAVPSRDKPISIIFDLQTPVNYPALPIEDIGARREEREVLLHCPRYKIITLDLIKGEEFDYYKAIIVVEGEE